MKSRSPSGWRAWDRRQTKMIDLRREITGDLESAVRREWLVTNGFGGFASGTVAGMNTRRYRGLLFAL